VRLGDYIPGNTVGTVETVENEISVVSQPGFINISAAAAINNVKVYSVTGALLISARPGQNLYQIPTNNLMPGIYIVKVATAAAQRNVKVLVK
jgi:hypothetical protein